MPSWAYVWGELVLGCKEAFMIHDLPQEVQRRQEGWKVNYRVWGHLDFYPKSTQILHTCMYGSLVPQGATRFEYT